MAAIKVTWPAIEFQSALSGGDRRTVAVAALNISTTDSIACAVDVPRPRIRRGCQEAARKAAIQAPLHGVIRRIPLAVTRGSHTEIRMESLPVWLQGVGGIPSRQLMTLRPHVGAIDDDFIRKLPLEAKGPTLCVWTAEVFLEDASLLIHQAGNAGAGCQKSLR